MLECFWHLGIAAFASIIPLVILLFLLILFIVVSSVVILLHVHIPWVHNYFGIVKSLLLLLLSRQHTRTRTHTHTYKHSNTILSMLLPHSISTLAFILSPTQCLLYAKVTAGIQQRQIAVGPTVTAKATHNCERKRKKKKNKCKKTLCYCMQ